MIKLALWGDQLGPVDRQRHHLLEQGELLDGADSPDLMQQE